MRLVRVVEPLIRARGLVLAYDDHVALDRSDLEIPGGKVTAIIGPNGSGKSTLLNAIAGLIEPRAGTLEVRVQPPVHRHVALVLQATRVNETMPVSVREVVAMGRYARLGAFRRFRRDDRRACDRALERLDVLRLDTRHLDRLSGGERQRVFVAQGLAQEADVLLLDEPVTGLDLVSRQRILDAVRAECERGAAVVMTTHDLGEAALADRVLLLAGRVVAEGPPDEVITPEKLSDAYGVPLVALEGGRIHLDDTHHAAGGPHRHFDRTGHAEHPQD